MNLYLYSGPVTQFGTCISHRWDASTYAVSPRKAKSNFIYQYKKQHSLSTDSKIELPGKIYIIANDATGERTID